VKLKYTVDKIFAVVLLCIFAPLLISIAILIKLEGLLFPGARGPILVSEPRISQGRVFQLYKFRKIKKKILDSIKEEDKESGSFSFTYFQKHPENLTGIGKILKKFYFDEFPQIFNVLRGDLSFVGLRPHLPNQYYEEVKHGIIYEKIMRSGLTGLGAVSKDRDKSKVDLDAEYFQRYSTYHPLKLLLYDISIMIKTVALVFRAKGF
jgi:lipopolysaccharide/colanic/teichoic acid biosynthesis glycosyltransferase